MSISNATATQTFEATLASDASTLNTDTATGLLTTAEAGFLSGQLDQLEAQTGTDAQAGGGTLSTANLTSLQTLQTALAKQMTSDSTNDLAAAGTSALTALATAVAAASSSIASGMQKGTLSASTGASLTSSLSGIEQDEEADKAGNNGFLSTAAVNALNGQLTKLNTQITDDEKSGAGNADATSSEVNALVNSFNTTANDITAGINAGTLGAATGSSLSASLSLIQQEESSDFGAGGGTLTTAQYTSLTNAVAQLDGTQTAGQAHVVGGEIAADEKAAPTYATAADINALTASFTQATEDIGAGQEAGTITTQEAAALNQQLSLVQQEFTGDYTAGGGDRLTTTQLAAYTTDMTALDGAQTAGQPHVVGGAIGSAESNATFYMTQAEETQDEGVVTDFMTTLSNDVTNGQLTAGQASTIRSTFTTEENEAIQQSQTVNNGQIISSTWTDVEGYLKEAQSSLSTTIANDKSTSGPDVGSTQRLASSVSELLATAVKDGIYIKGGSQYDSVAALIAQGQSATLDEYNALELAPQLLQVQRQLTNQIVDNQATTPNNGNNGGWGIL